MKGTLITFYRNKDLYTLFYNQDDGLIYKIPIRKKNSYVKVYFGFLALYITGNILNGFYQRYNSLFLDVSMFIIGIVIAYFTANKLHQTYYAEEKIHPIVLDDSFLEECACEGMRQSRIELNVAIISFFVTVVAFIVFFAINSIIPLIIGYLGTAIFLGIIYMKPLKRRKVIKKIRDEK
ncbi:hypothetical protein ACUL41_15210 [Virgibacillus natechei]